MWFHLQSCLWWMPFYARRQPLSPDFLRGPRESYKQGSWNWATWGLPGRLFDTADYDVLRENLLISSAWLMGLLFIIRKCPGSKEHKQCSDFFIVRLLWKCVFPDSHGQISQMSQKEMCSLSYGILWSSRWTGALKSNCNLSFGKTHLLKMTKGIKYCWIMYQW